MFFIQSILKYSTMKNELLSSNFIVPFGFVSAVALTSLCPFVVFDNYLVKSQDSFFAAHPAFENSPL